MSNVKNYTEAGGEKTVIGGTLQITSERKLIIGSTELKQAEAQANSSATTIADLKSEFNQLLEKLKSAGLMADT